jgi:hypothetical protein
MSFRLLSLTGLGFGLLLATAEGSPRRSQLSFRVLSSAPRIPYLGSSMFEDGRLKFVAVVKNNRAESCSVPVDLSAYVNVFSAVRNGKPLSPTADESPPLDMDPGRQFRLSTLKPGEEIRFDLIGVRSRASRMIFSPAIGTYRIRFQLELPRDDDPTIGRCKGTLRSNALEFEIVP